MSEMKTHYVGARISRVDAHDKVTGNAVYGVDVDLPGMLFGAVLRSPLPHARITEIDVSGAMRAPGVRAVVTGKDFPFTFGGAVKDQPFLAIDRVRYVGEPVAAVAAETELEAYEALRRIRVKYDELPAVFDPREAVKEGAPLIHPDLEHYSRAAHDIVPGTNICTIRTYRLGDVEAGFDAADEILTSINKVLISAIKLVLAGGIYVPPEAVLHGRSTSRSEAAGVHSGGAGEVHAAAVAPDERGHHRSNRPLAALTERQWEVLWLLLEGLSNKQICRALDLAEATVKVHVRAILRELGARSRAEAIVVAGRIGIQRPIHPKPQ